MSTKRPKPKREAIRRQMMLEAKWRGINTAREEAVDQQRHVGPFREFDPKIELPHWLDEYKWHSGDSRWSQAGRDATPADVASPHYPKVWRTRRPPLRTASRLAFPASLMLLGRT